MSEQYEKYDNPMFLTATTLLELGDDNKILWIMMLCNKDELI